MSTRTNKAERDLLAVTIAADMGSTFLQPGNAGPNLTPEGTREIVLKQVEVHARLNDVREKHVKDMQETARAFFDRHFAPLYALYFKAGEKRAKQDGKVAERSGTPGED